MVDSINQAGASQPVQGSRKTQEQQAKPESKAEARNNSAPVDQVTLSEEALSLTQAEEAAQKVSKALTQDPKASLSVDQQRLSTLV